MEVAPNPVSIIESYFNIKLGKVPLEKLYSVDKEEWIDFFKNYLSVMEHGFANTYLDNRNSSHSVRLYFEPSLSHDWANKVTERYSETPLLGYRAFQPSEDVKITRARVSDYLNPLKKHLLLADAVFIKDRFYDCFDMVSDSVNRAEWRSNPNILQLVDICIARVKAFLPILVELRELILSKVLVFMPYYVAPTFPYANVPKELDHHVKRIRVMDPSGEVWAPGGPALEFNKVLVPWLNAQLLGLDPVYLTEEMARVGATLKFDDGSGPPPSHDLLSLGILPFGGADGIDLDTLLKMRRNEEVFAQIRRLTSECKMYLEENLGLGATPQAASVLSKQFLQDQLSSLATEKVLSFSDNLTVGLAWRIGLSVATLGTSEIISTAASAILDRSVGEVVLSRVSPERRAISYLNAAL